VTESCFVLPPDKCARGLSMSFYNNDQINILQEAMNLACLELGIGLAESLKRERVALLVARNSWGWRSDVGRLESFAVQRFETSPWQH
jgi:hypothetical protein